MHTIRKWRQPGNDKDAIDSFLQKHDYSNMAKQYMLLPRYKHQLVARINDAVTDEELCQLTMDRSSSSPVSTDWRKNSTGCLVPAETYDFSNGKAIYMLP